MKILITLIAVFAVLDVTAKPDPIVGELLAKSLQKDYYTGALFSQTPTQPTYGCNSEGRITWNGIDTGLYKRKFCIGTETYEMNCFGGKINVVPVLTDTCSWNTPD